MQGNCRDALRKDLGWRSRGGPSPNIMLSCCCPRPGPAARPMMPELKNESRRKRITSAGMLRTFGHLSAGEREALAGGFK